MLHRFVKEIKGAKADGDICWPAPGAILDLPIKLRHCIFALCLTIHTEHEHTRQHLVEDDSDGPHIYLMAIAAAAAPVHTELLRCHHER